MLLLGRARRRLRRYHSFFVSNLLRVYPSCLNKTFFNKLYFKGCNSMTHAGSATHPPPSLGVQNKLVLLFSIQQLHPPSIRGIGNHRRS